MLDQNKINQFTQKARAAGFNDQQIAAEIARKKKEMEQPVAPQQPIQPVSNGMDMSDTQFSEPKVETQPEHGGLFSNLKKGGQWIVDNIFPATKNFVQDVSSGLTVKSKDYENMVKSNQDAQAQVSKLVERAKTETDPEKKKRLLDLAREQSAKLGQILEEGTPKFSKDVEKNAIERGLAVGTELGTTVVPVAGKGATATARVLSAAKQGAIISGSRAATSLEEMTPEERLKKTLVDAGFGALTVGGLQAGGEAVSKLARGSKVTTDIGKNITQKGSDIRQGVRKIHEPAGVWSASKEQTINDTLDTLKIGGTADEQYKQLEPAYEKLTKSISDYLKTKGKPVDSKKIQTAVQADLADIPGDVLAEAQGLKEFEKISKEVAKIKDSQSLFDMKKWLNGRLGRVYTKLEKGNPLSPAEEVLLQSRDTIDSAITKLHPDIKELTLTQSHLRDAAPSLAKARLVVPTQRIAGTTVPASLTQKATDIVGKTIQGTGKVVEKAGQVGEFGFGFAERPVQAAVRVGQKVAPLTSPSMPFENIQEVTQDTQSNENEAAQNQNGQTSQGNIDHKQSVSQTATGHTVEEHLKALSMAQAAGDKEGVKAITSQLNIEKEYQKTTGVTGKPLSGANVVLLNKANTAGKAIDEITKALIDKEGNFNSGKLWAKKLNPLSQSGRQLGKDIVSAIDILGYFRTGAAITAEQRKDYIYMFPNEFDDKATVEKKLKDLKAEFDGYSKGISETGVSSLEELLGGFNGQ